MQTCAIRFWQCIAYWFAIAQAVAFDYTVCTPWTGFMTQGYPYLTRMNKLRNSRRKLPEMTNDQQNIHVRLCRLAAIVAVLAFKIDESHNAV